MTHLSIQEYASFDALAGLRSDWNKLVARENYGPSQSFEWLSTLWDVNNANRRLRVLVARDSAGIVGIAPFVQEMERRKGMPTRILKMLSGFHSLHGTPLLLSRNKEQTIHLFFDYLRGRPESWTIWLSLYTAGDSQEDLLFSLLREQGYPFSTTPAVRSPYQRIAETWDEKLKSLQPRFRTALRSREKRLREKGRVELRFLDGSAEWENGLTAIREIEEDSWKIDAGTAITIQDVQWQFYTRYAPIAAEAKTLRIPILYVDGEPVAYDYALFVGGTYYLLKTSYKNKWRDYHPGFVLRKLLVEWTYAQGALEIDFLGKDEDWKMKWTSSAREHRSCYIFSRTLVARCLHGLHRAKSLLRRER